MKKISEYHTIGLSLKWVGVVAVLLLILQPHVSLAQNTPRNISSGQPMSTDESQGPDSVHLHYFKINHLDQAIPYTDSTLHSQDHNYDPARLTDVDYIHLGNQGSAASPLRYESNPYIGFHVGHTQYDLYNFTLEDFRFYEGNIPFLNAGFSPMGSQDNFVVHAEFSRSFSDGFTVSSNYQRVLQVGTYQSQATKITNLGVSLRYIHPGKRYRGFLSIISNADQENHNGGPTTVNELVSNPRGLRSLVDTKISGATTRHQQKYYSLVNYYKLNSKYSGYDLSLRYDVGYDARYYKFSDPNTNTIADTNYYQHYNTDFRGIRHLTRVNRWHNGIYTYFSDGKRLNARVGLVYDRYQIEQDTAGSTYDNVYLDLDGEIPFLKSLALKTKAQLGIGDGAGDFNVRGALNVDTGQWLEMEAGISFYRQTPTLLQRSLFITQRPVWPPYEQEGIQEFAKPLGSEFFASLAIPKLRLTADVSQHIVDNAIYFDTLARPVQDTSVYTATVFTLKHNIGWKIFNLENTFLLQVFSNNIYQLPTYWSKHNFYMEFPMFKKNLLARWGWEMRSSLLYRGQAFNPAVGTFHQGRSDTAWYPMMDAYFSGKVQKFKVFVKLENIFQLINAAEIDYRIENHPQQDWGIRFGIEWLFLG